MKRETMKKILTGMLLISSVNLTAQSIEKILTAARPSTLLKNKEIKISGQISSGFSLYNADPISNRNAPFFYHAAGGLVIDVFGKFKLPFNFSYINKTATSTLPGPLRIPNIQPFNRFQLKPKYKGFELQIGTGSMSFSKYTLNGHRFDGIGVNYKSDKIPVYGGLVTGRLLKKVIEIPEGSFIKPSYQRNGFAGFIGYKSNDNFAEISIFKAKDVASPTDSIFSIRNINPFDNLATSLKFKTKVFDRFSLLADFGLSKTSNLNGFNPNINNKKWKFANDLAIDYQLKSQKIGLNYQYIDPNFNTFGAYFFNKDIELITLNYSGDFLKDQNLKVNSRVGHQRRNLRKTEAQTIGGWESSIDINYKFLGKHQFNASYSSFSSFSNFNPFFNYLSQTPYYENIDTLNFRQVNQNISLMANLALPKIKMFDAEIILNTLLQNGDDNQGEKNLHQNMQNYMASFVLKNPKKQSQLSLMYNRVVNNTMGLSNKLSGPSIQLMIPISDKGIKLNMQLGYSRSEINNPISNYQENSKLLMVNSNISYQLKKKHNFSLRYLHNKKFNFDSEYGMIGGFQENTPRFSYKFAFDLFKISLKK